MEPAGTVTTRSAVALQMTSTDFLDTSNHPSSFFHKKTKKLRTIGTCEHVTCDYLVEDSL